MLERKSGYRNGYRWSQVNETSTLTKTVLTILGDCMDLLTADAKTNKHPNNDKNVGIKWHIKKAKNKVILKHLSNVSWFVIPAHKL